MINMPKRFSWIEYKELAKNKNIPIAEIDWHSRLSNIAKESNSATNRLVSAIFYSIAVLKCFNYRWFLNRTIDRFINIIIIIIVIVVVAIVISIMNNIVGKQ